jgi:hypothetical protein
MRLPLPLPSPHLKKDQERIRSGKGKGKGMGKFKKEREERVVFLFPARSHQEVVEVFLGENKKCFVLFARGVR